MSGMRSLCGVLLSVGLVVGCGESDVTLHEPGQYHGAKDPLTMQSTAEREETLKKRFQLVQVDR